MNLSHIRYGNIALLQSIQVQCCCLAQRGIPDRKHLSNRRVFTTCCRSRGWLESHTTQPCESTKDLPDTMLCIQTAYRWSSIHRCHMYCCVHFLIRIFRKEQAFWLCFHVQNACVPQTENTCVTWPWRHTFLCLDNTYPYPGRWLIHHWPCVYNCMYCLSSYFLQV